MTKRNISYKKRLKLLIDSTLDREAPFRKEMSAEDYEDDFAGTKEEQMKVGSGEEKLEIVTQELSPMKSSAGTIGSPESPTRKPMLYLSWDGEENSRANVDKLKRFLRAKGYIIFEHAGDASISGDDGNAIMDTTTSGEGDDTPITTNTGASGASGASLESARAKVSDEVTQKLKLCTVFVSCVTRKFTFNMHCKKLVLHCRKLVETDRKKAPEMLYVMVHGDFTTESQPYHCREGWLGYMLRDALWSPAWSHAHIAGAAEAIGGVIALRRNVIKLNPQHVLYIESRGKQGQCPPHSVGS